MIAVKKELISRVIGDRGIGNSRAIWQKVIVRTFDDFIIPGGRCPLFRSMAFDARSVKREAMSRRGQWRGIETRYTTTRRDFFTGGEHLSDRIKPSLFLPLSICLSISFILSSRCSVYSQSGSSVPGCDFSEASMSKVGKTFNGTNSTRGEEGEESRLFSRPTFRRRL